MGILATILQTSKIRLARRREHRKEKVYVFDIFRKLNVFVPTSDLERAEREYLFNRKVEIVREAVAL